MRSTVKINTLEGNLLDLIVHARSAIGTPKKTKTKANEIYSISLNSDVKCWQTKTA